MSDITDFTSQLAEATAQLTAEGAPFEILERQINSVPLRCYRHAPATLRDALAQGRQYADKVFITYQDESLSFDQFFEQADRFGHYLVNKLGVARGDRVAIAMRNYPEWMAAYVAIVSVGAIVVPLNSWGQGDELEYTLSDAGAQVVICDQQRLDALGDRLDRLSLTAVVVRPTHESASDNVIHWESTQQAPSDMPDAEIGPGDLAMIMYTSGTTGNPKGAASTNFAICQALMNFECMATLSAMVNPDAIGKMFEAGFEPATLLSVPLFHVSGCYSVFMLNLRGGRKTSIMYKWDVDDALAIIERERITTFTGVPTMTMALMQSPAWDTTDTASLFAIGAGGTASPPHLKDLIYEKLPSAYPGTGYGMTETNATCSSFTGRGYQLKPGASGTVAPVVDLKTVDDAGNDLPPGSTGEFYVRSPTNVQQYWNLPEATSATFIDGWVATGDVGYVDEDGFVHVVDRIKDMVIRGGENIYPIEIEGSLLTHPGVHEAAVFGLPHDTWGEEVAADVYADAGVDESTLQAFLSERIAAFKVPTYIRVSTEPLPKNATGKVLKKAIRQAWLDNR